MNVIMPIYDELALIALQKMVPGSVYLNSRHDAFNVCFGDRSVVKTLKSSGYDLWLGDSIQSFDVGRDDAIAFLEENRK